jgi:hypothetical protein
MSGAAGAIMAAGVGSVNLTDQTFSTLPVTANTPGITQLSTGMLQQVRSNGANADIKGQWFTASISATDAARYWCRVTVNTGTLATGVGNVWVSCATDHTWGVAAGSSAQFTFAIARDAAGTDIIDSCTINLAPF